MDPGRRMKTAPSSQHPFTPVAIGTGASQGFAVGPAVTIRPQKSLDLSRAFESADSELARFRKAHSAVTRHLRKLIEKTGLEVGAEEALIFEAHLMMIDDEELTGPIRAAIVDEQLIPEAAIRRVFDAQIRVFEQSESEYLRERTLDLRDLETQLLEELQPGTSGSVHLDAPGILIAEDLAPSQTLLLDRSRILGIVTRRGGSTSHSAIIARTLGIPAVSGVQPETLALPSGSLIAIDGREGSVFLAKTPEIEGYFAQRSVEFRQQVHELETFRGKPTLTHDLHPIRLYGNIGGIEDAERASASDVEGIGLFRTEFLFMGRKTAPSFEEQRKTYRRILSMFRDREVVIRTLDVGGDKPIEYIDIPEEENPFLGLRAIRYCTKDPDLFRTQIRALLSANEDGNLSILIPMVSRASEMKRVLNWIEECEEALIRTGEYHDQPWRLGAMVEIPSLIYELRELREYASFISVGTNDLLQYSLAVDRGNPEIADLYSPYHLGFLRMMRHLAREADEYGLEAGICGEVAGQEELIPLWIAMGYQKLSMVASEVLSRRRAVSKLSRSQCEGILREVLEMRDERWIRPFLQSSI
ncbi:phosphoenolpyruvate--protein phosphotransferase [bacterium]|nr:phosphoenolpyruvate--protein phosphotransferase [bacterium]